MNMYSCRSNNKPDTSSQLPKTNIPTATDDYFQDITSESGINFVHSFGDDELSNLVESVGGGAVFLDFDQDGYLDLYLTSGSYNSNINDDNEPDKMPTNRLYRNKRDGTFIDVTKRAGVGDQGYGMGTAVADYNNDGYPDIFVSNYGPNVFYQNNGDGTFSDVTNRSGLTGNVCSVGAVWLDYDNDGLLDLYVGNYIQYDPDYSYYYAPDGFPGPLAYAGQADILYHNLGDGTFEDVTKKVGVFQSDGRAMGVSAADYDNDGFTDIYIANDATENFLFRNINGQRFEEVALLVGVAYNEMGDATSSMAVDFADYNSDGLMDIFISDVSYSSLYKNVGNGIFKDLTSLSGIAAASGQYIGWGASFIDYDNDGDLDLFKVNGDLQHLFGQEDQIFENRGEDKFKDVSIERGSYFRKEFVGRGASFGDYDNDGDIDVFIVNLSDRGILLRNNEGNQNNWLLINLVGKVSNRDGVGARIKLTAGGKVQVAQKKSSSGYLSQNDPRIHFGLGKNEMVEHIEIVWPSGRSQILENIPAGRILTITEPSE